MSDTGQPTSYIELLAPIWPGGDFGSHEDIFGKGGFITLQDSVGSDTDTDFINTRVRRSRRKEGMLVYINDNGRYYRCTDIGTNNNDGVWKREYFTGRYFYGPNAPDADDIVMGERWFDTIVGTEYTYVPIAEGSTYLAWIDLDHMGEGDRYINSDGDVFTGTLTGDILDVNHITADTGFIGTLTGNIADFGHITADTGFIGTLTGNIADFGHITADTGFIGTLTGTDASFDSITASNGFIGTLTGNYIDIPSLGDFGSQIRVASNGSLGMPYLLSSMHSLDLWSRLHLIGGGGQTGYSLRISTSGSGTFIEESQGKIIFDQGYTHGVALSPYGTSNIVDGIAGISFFGTDLYTGKNSRSDTSMPYDGVTNSNYSGMLTLGMNGRGYIPRMFSTRRTNLLDTFDSNEFITKRHFENNTRSENGNVYIQFSVSVKSTSSGNTITSWNYDFPDTQNDAGGGSNQYYSFYIGEKDVPFPKPWKVTVLRQFYPATPIKTCVLSSPNISTAAVRNACMKNSFVVGAGKNIGVEQRVFGDYEDDGVATFFGTGSDAGLDTSKPKGLPSLSGQWYRIKCAAHRVGSYDVPKDGTYYTEIYIVPHE